MNRVAGNQAMVRKNNQNLIVEFVKENGPISRAELSKKLNISKPTISSNIELLLNMGIIKEIGEGKSIGGRKPILVQFNKNYKYIIAIDLSRGKLSIALGNLLGEIVHIESAILESKLDEKLIEKNIISLIYKVLDKSEINSEKISCITIASPGIMNDDTGQIRLNPQFIRWDKINLNKRFIEEFNSKVIIKNDINLAALGEQKYGQGKDVDNLAYISLGLGIGSGLIINGQLYEGKHRAAGEIGNLPFKDDDGEYKYLESIISIPRVLESIKKDLKNGVDTKIREFIEDDLTKLTFQVFKRALRRKDEYAVKITEKIIERLSVAMANMCMVMDIEMVVIGGEICEMGERVIKPIEEFINKFTPFNIMVKPTKLNNYASIYGGFEVALQYTFENFIE